MASAWYQFRALFRKNLLGMKRNIVMSIIEITFPIVLLMIGHFVREAFTREHHHYKEEGGIDKFVVAKSLISFPPDIEYAHLEELKEIAKMLNFTDDFTQLQALTDQNISDFNMAMKYQFHSDIGLGAWTYEDKAGGKNRFVIPTYKGFSIKPLISIICHDRFKIAYVGTAFDDEEEESFDCTKNTLLCSIAQSIKIVDGLLPGFQRYGFKRFSSIKEMNDYVEASDYGKKANKPEICFGISAFKEGEKDYSVNLHYFDNYILEGKKLYFIFSYRNTGCSKQPESAL